MKTTATPLWRKTHKVLLTSILPFAMLPAASESQGAEPPAGETGERTGPIVLEEKLVIADRRIAAYRLGGYFETQDIAGFVEALENAFPIEAVETAGEVTLIQRTR